MRQLFFVFFFVVSLCAYAGQEIGEPYIETTKAERIHSATLAPDGKSIYTLTNDLITQWQLSPLKKLTSFHAGALSGNSSFRRFKIHVNKDNTKLILQSNEELQLWDIGQKRLLKHIKIGPAVGTISNYGFITVDEHTLKIWDQNTLKLLDTISTFLEKPADWIGPNDPPAEWEDLRIPTNVIAGETIVVIDYPQKRVYLNIEKRVSQEDLKKEEYLSEYGRQFCFEKIMSIVLNRMYSERRPVSYACLSNDIGIVLSSHSHNINVIRKNNKLLLVVHFNQFSDALFIKSIYRLRLFSSSGDITKYLKMRTKEGKIMPMNNATYRAYYRKNLFLEW